MPAIVRPVGDERDALAAYLAHERHVLIVAAYGLTDEQARRTPTVSALSIEGLLTHMTTTERSWASTIAGTRPRPVSPEPNETLEQVVADYQQAIADTDAVIAAVDDLDRIVPVPEGTAVGATRPRRLVGALDPPPPRSTRPRATPGTPTSSASRSTARPRSRSWPRSSSGRRAGPSNRGRRPRRDARVGVARSRQLGGVAAPPRARRACAGASLRRRGCRTGCRRRRSGRRGGGCVARPIPPMARGVGVPAAAR